MASDEDSDEHLEEVEEYNMTLSDSIQNMFKGNRRETKLTLGKCRCMSKTDNPVEEKLIKF